MNKSIKKKKKEEEEDNIYVPWAGSSSSSSGSHVRKTLDNKLTVAGYFLNILWPQPRPTLKEWKKRHRCEQPRAGGRETWVGSAIVTKGRVGCLLLYPLDGKRRLCAT